MTRVIVIIDNAGITTSGIKSSHLIRPVSFTRRIILVIIKNNETVRALRHDLKNHLLCISSMANEKDIQGIQQYTQQLLQQQNAVSKLITFSGNTALDAIVNSKSTTAEHVGVQLRAIITTPLSDISIILGNALDNAIRAAKDSIGKTVDLYIQPQGAYNSIVIINDIARSVLSDNPTLTTTKVKCSQHGFGIKNIRQAVERNQGMLEFFEQNNRFEYTK